MTPPARTNRRRSVLRAWPAVLLVWAATIGCDDGGNGLNNLGALQRENAQLKEQAQQLRATIADRDQQIQTLQTLGSKRLELLFPPAQVRLGRYTGGVDLDDKPGDEGIRAYLEVKDAKGHAIKAAGAVRVQLFDLAAKPKENLVATFDFPAEGIGEYYASGFLTSHYMFDCRWEKPPAHNDITVRLSFTDYLTGKTFTDQKLCTISPPPAD